jgi:hypothetical protein
MIRKNIYSRITESIVNAYHDNNLDSAMDDGHEMENMGKKIVAIITADPDQDLDWESEYEPFGATELTADDEQDTCVSCGHPVMDDEENDDMEDIMIGGGFESEDEDDYEDMDVKDILVDILQELKGEDSDSDSEEEGAFETSDENPMFGGSEESDDEESDDEDEWEDDSDDEDYDSMLSDNDSDWGNDEEDSDEEDYDDEEDFEQPLDEESCEPQEQEEDEVEIFDCLDNA